MASKAANDDAIKALALRMGAAVRLSNGETFNAGGTRAKVVKAPETKVEAPPASYDLLERIVEMLSQQKTPQVVMPELPPPNVVVEAPQVTVQPAPVPVVTPTSWKFTFERNESGTIRSITATPTL